jgi:sigma-E factor negative regulatory protein RseA
MTESVNEQLSACLDGQLPEGELDLLIKRVGRDSELRQTLGRYALVGEALRGHGAAQASAGFADRIAAAIDAETSQPSGAVQPSARVNPSVLRWLRPIGGVAVAAGVAAVAVFVFQSNAPQPDARVAQSPAPVVAPAVDSYIVPSTTVSNFIPATRLTNYVVAHSEYSSPLGRRTVLSGVLSEEDDANAAAANAEEVSAEHSQPQAEPVPAPRQ